MENYHNLAIKLENTVRGQWKLNDRSEFGGVIDADIFEDEPRLALYLALAPMYLAGKKTEEIDEFIKEYGYSNESIEEIGADKIEKLIDKLEELIK